MSFAVLQRRSEIGAGHAQRQRSPTRALVPPRAQLALLQPKLRIGAPNDRFETEADSIADLIVGMPAPVIRSVGSDASASSKPGPSILQRQCAACREEAQLVQRECTACSEPQLLQRLCSSCEEEASIVRRQCEREPPNGDLQRAEGNGGAGTPGAGAARSNAQAAVPAVLASAGTPLSPSLRRYFEPRFGRDLRTVRVHFGPQAATAAASVGANAFTAGHHIVFNTGQYAPGTSAGRRLLAHELTHVLQQRGGLHSIHRQVLQRASERASGGSPTVEAEPSAELFDTSREGPLQRECIEGEGPPTPEPPLPEEPGPHPLILRGTSTKRSRRPAVGDAQRLLNRFLSELKAGTFKCKPGADLVAIASIRSTLEQDPLDVDCRFGPNTEKATRMFQHCVFPKQPHEWDGKIGPNTWPQLDALRAPPTPSPSPTPTPSPKKPGTQTACARTCESNFDRCLQGFDGLTCLGQRARCFGSCPANEPASFVVCARLLQPPVEVSGCNHTYVETPTRRYAIITPCSSKASFALPGGGVAIKTNVSPDPCHRPTTCVPCQARPGVTDLEACFASQFAAYAAPSKHHILGPNSNTFAGTLARACCSNMDPMPAAFGCTPGWDDPPAPAAASTTCPSGPPVC